MSQNMGRPTEYKPVYVEVAREMCQQGATVQELAEAFEVTRQTVWQWALRHKDFANAIEMGKETADKRVERSLYEKAQGYSYDAIKIHVTKDGEVIKVPYVEHVPPSETAMIFWLKNRKPDVYREKREEQVDAKVEIVIKGGLKEPEA